MTAIRVQRTSITWLLVRVVWRFASGSHLNGQTYNDATWWRDASVHYRKRRLAYTWWRRKSRMKRAAWRHSVLWPVVLVSAGLALERLLTIVLLACMMPGLFVIVFRKGRLLLYQPVKQHHSDGHVTQGWVMRVRTRHVVDALRFRRVVIGLATRNEKKKKIRALPVPSEYANAVRNEVAPELGWQPPTEMKLLMSPEE